MQKKPQKTIRRPTYALESVDNALRLLQMLRDEGELRLTDAATALDIAPSTAHRLLAMLVYRGFAVHDERRRYHPGPALGAGPALRGWTRELGERCRPHMEALSALTGETVNLVIRVGTQARFLATAEGTNLLRVGDRQGQVLPAELTAGGRILLAELPRPLLEQLYLRPESDDTPDRRMDRAEFERFARELEAARAAGFAVNLEQTETDVAAFGAAIRNGRGQAIASISVAVPSTRYRRHLQGPLLARLHEATRGIGVDVAAIEL
ncbi:IclR family transcriptional regulator [Nocardia aurantia]|uniref:IclR family transcriptional regulator n=1 Tax=Nocardia aurantia TaxID=2585199 RepID=UPI0029E7D52D|nr:IclR family transcriptional regulator [Nocardia aurantia]